QTLVISGTISQVKAATKAVAINGAPTEAIALRANPPLLKMANQNQMVAQEVSQAIVHQPRAHQVEINAFAEKNKSLSMTLILN
ncbi:hypothetical protein N9X12_05310, partial [Alphaproteobacteria bacterium]|nr:hypothetical protein [Alphaproteobacteria bacterium]